MIHPEIFLLLIVVGMMLTSILIGINKNLDHLFAFGQTDQAKSSVTNTENLHEIETKKVHVGDIDIAYKMFGEGNPVLLVNGFTATLDFWDPILLKKLASNHTVITIDNRGIGNTTSGDKKFTITQFANDTSGLLDALKIKKADVIGWSMGGMIAQELALAHPDKVGKLIIYASTCGGNETAAPSPEVMNAFENQSGTRSEREQKLLPLLFPEEWRTQNPSYLENLPITAEIVSDKTVAQQKEAILSWLGTCNQLKNIIQPTLVIVGTEDVFTPPANSLLITKNIPGASLVQMQGGGHALSLQYPEKFSKVLSAFLNEEK
jgi:pimeloyl-ACP methyl ester carboxylesterase